MPYRLTIDWQDGTDAVEIGYWLTDDQESEAIEIKHETMACVLEHVIISDFGDHVRKHILRKEAEAIIDLK